MRCNLMSEEEIKNQINSKKEEISKIEEEFKERSSSIKSEVELEFDPKLNEIKSKLNAEQINQFDLRVRAFS